MSATNNKPITDENSDRAAALQRLVNLWSGALDSSRYFLADNDCADISDYPSWQGINLRRCQYHETDSAGLTRKATVIAHFPTAEQIARWIVDSAYATGHKKNHYMDRLFAHIICQSGGQFPVAGIVLEDEDSKPPLRAGVFENHCFRDGVTIQAGNTWILADEGPLTAAKVNQCLNSPATKVLKFARLQATTREDYKANGGTEPVGTSPYGLHWEDVSRNLYKAALGNDRNELMLAWARTNLGHQARKKDDPCVCKFKLTRNYCVP